MSKRMLIDANHPEETRVVVLSGTRLEEFDYETTAKKQLKGNIYLAKVTRVEPSLQAAFVEYGGGRHGFLPFSEIHPDYYRIPIADREALTAEEAALRGNGLGDEEDDAEFEAVNGNGIDGEDQGGADQGDPDEDAEAEQEATPSEAGQETEKVEQLEAERRVDTLGGDEVEDDRRRRARLLRRYKIQEVIKRRQIILVQVA
ncbi:MAG: S1 RNA-binding domain-containing protein [Kiloniellales bacterium]